MDQNKEIIDAFIGLGLSEQKAKETLKNDNVTKTLKFILNEVGLIIFNFQFFLNFILDPWS